MNEFSYVGGELELFAHAHHWKDYWSSQLRPFIRGAVLEVGAGIGSNTVRLRTGAEPRWLCLEPDPQLIATLKSKIAESPAGRGTEIHSGTLASRPATETFDTILYIDVLEHIADDREELERAARHLKPQGNLIVLSPAHPWLFSPFDQAIGHYRRYTTRTLKALHPPGLRVVRAFYLDAVGLLASAANRLWLRQSLPGAKQLAFWDKVLVPASRIVDPLTLHRLGKTVICIWERD